MDYISTLIDLNILCLLDLVWWSHLFSPWWDLQKIILFTNLFSVSIWFTKCDDGGSNFASSLVASFLSSHVEACYCHDLLHRSAHITLHCSHSDLSSYLSNKCVPRLLSIARNDARDMKMSCFKVKPRSQVTKSTVTIRHQKHNIWQPYVLVGHLARHPLPKTCSNNRMDFFSFVFVFFFFFVIMLKHLGKRCYAMATWSIQSQVQFWTISGHFQHPELTHQQWATSVA